MSNNALTHSLAKGTVRLGEAFRRRLKGKPRRPPEQQLISRCTELSCYLRGFGEVHWSVWLDECVAALKAGHPRGAQRVLSGCNGMGGLPDLYLCPEAGHSIRPDQEADANQRLLVMVARVRALAQAARDAARSGPGAPTPTATE